MKGVRNGALLALLSLFAIVGLVSADLVIPPDQPICRLYGMIQIVGTVAGVIAAAYAGFILASNNDIAERNGAKALLGGVVLGLVIIWVAPLLVQNLVGSTGVCGW